MIMLLGLEITGVFAQSSRILRVFFYCSTIYYYYYKPTCWGITLKYENFDKFNSYDTEYCIVVCWYKQIIFNNDTKMCLVLIKMQ